MKQIFAHRALMNFKEHSIEGISFFAKLGLGLELDIRKNSTGLYLSHDPTGKGILFDEICQILSESNSLVALHIKELDTLPLILKSIKKFSLKNFFIFDSDYNRMCSIFDSQNVGFYVNRKPEKNLTSRILWCDEVKENWYSVKNIDNLHNQNKVIYSVSRELVIDSTMNEIHSDWLRLIQLGFDGICTNYPLELQKFWKEVNSN